jgi:hypothetical protein
LEKVNLGRSCPAAIRDRYGEVKNDEAAGIDKEDLSLLQCKINAPFLEVVGFDKVNKKQRSVLYQTLHIVGDKFNHSATVKYLHIKNVKMLCCI